MSSLIAYSKNWSLSETSQSWISYLYMPLIIYLQIPTVHMILSLGFLNL